MLVILREFFFLLLFSFVFFRFSFFRLYIHHKISLYLPYPHLCTYSISYYNSYDFDSEKGAVGDGYIRQLMPVSLLHSQALPQNEGLLVPPGYVALLMPASRLHGGKDKTKESFENNDDDEEEEEDDDDETIAVLVPTPSSAGRLNQPRFSGIKSFAGASSSPSAFSFSPTTLELLSDIRGIMRSSE